MEMLNLFKPSFIIISAVFRHLRSYWLYYFTLFGLPFIYNKMTYDYRWTKLSVFSIKFGNLYFLSILLMVLLIIIAATMQWFGVQKEDSQKFNWKSRFYQFCYYTVPAGLGLCTLIVFKLLWYEGEDLSRILVEHAKSRFLMFLVFFVGFTIWLALNPELNWLISNFPKRSMNGGDTHNELIVTSENSAEKVELSLENVAQVMESTILSVLGNNLLTRDDKQVKAIVIEAIQEYVESNEVEVKNEVVSSMPAEICEYTPDIEKIATEREYQKALLKQTMHEVVKELEDIKDVPLENLYANVYAKSLSNLKPSFNAKKALPFFHIFAIESHAKNAVVVLTDGTRINVDSIIDILKNMGLFKWMVKVNRFYYINMMHVCFMDFKNGNIVHIQRPTYLALQEHLTKKDITTICQLGSKIKDTNIKEFLEARFELSYEGWNAFVSLQ